MASVIPRTSSSAGAAEVAWIAERARSALVDPHRYLLVLRFALVNIVAFALLGTAYFQGYIDLVLAADRTYLCVLIAGVFVVGLVQCSFKVVQTSRDLNAVRENEVPPQSEAGRYLAKVASLGTSSRTVLAGMLRLRLAHRLTIVRNIATNLVVLGLIGTVIGFIIALSGVDPERASDFDSISPMVSTLISGMSTALYTTLVGAVLSIWLMIDYHMLATGTVKLIAAIVELGERHGRD